MRAILVLLAAASIIACDRNSSGRDRPTVPPTPAAISFDGADYKGETEKLAHGERIGRVLGCSGCHGKDLRGQEWDNDPKGYGTLWASNLTRVIPGMTDAQLEALLRHGRHPTRAEMWLMPSELFQHLSDDDMAALIAYLRSVEPGGEPSPVPVLGPKAIAEVKAGTVKPAALMVKDADHRLPRDYGPSTAQGRYIVATTCAECHGGQLEGGDQTPDLTAAAAYSRTEFERLMIEGIPTGDRKLGLMAEVAKGRFSQMTVSERDALYAYLKARAERPAPASAN